MKYRHDGEESDKLGSVTITELITFGWEQGPSITEEHYYNEPLPKERFNKKTHSSSFPP